MKKKVQTPKQKADPLAEVRQFVQEQRQLLAAQTAALERVTESESALDRARRDLAEAQSQKLIDDPACCDLDGQDTSSPFVLASLKVEECKAALGGIRRRISERDIQLLSISEKLRCERDSYNAGVIQKFLADVLEPAGQVYARSLRQGAALEDALGAEIAELHRLPARGEWADDAEAKRLHKDHVGLRKLAEGLDEFRRDAEIRQLGRERDKLRVPPFDPGARFRVRKEFHCFGRLFERDTLLDASDIPLSLLGKLHSTGHLRTIEKVNEWEEA